MAIFYALRTGTTMNPLRPQAAKFYDKGQTAYVLFKTSEARTRPTRVYTSFHAFKDVRIGTIVNLTDDQTGANLGAYKVSGIHDFASGEMAGDVINLNLPHSVAK